VECDRCFLFARERIGVGRSGRVVISLTVVFVAY